MIKIRCKACGVELTSHPTLTRCCGCSNLTVLRGDIISAKNLAEVVIISADSDLNKPIPALSKTDLEYQELRKNRKVRKLDFEIR